MLFSVLQAFQNIVSSFSSLRYSQNKTTETGGEKEGGEREREREREGEFHYGSMKYDN
jgi:hypothetical protein